MSSRFRCALRHDREPIQLINFGGVYPLTENIVLDTSLAFDLNLASTNFELTAGISVRF